VTPGSTVRLLEGAAGMAAGSAGIAVGWYTDTLEVLVRFWDGGPLRVPGELLQTIDEPDERTSAA